LPDVLIVADTVRSPEMRHEVPVAVPDPFIYAERNGARHAFVGSMEVPRLQELDRLEAKPLEELNYDELIQQGMPYYEIERELVLRACRQLGVSEAVTPRTFPLEVADYLRANGVALEADGDLFDRRRRAKSEAELAGIRRALRAAEAAMGAIRERLRGSNGTTCEELRAEAMRVFSERGMMVPDLVIVSHGPQTAVGHEPGHGPVASGESVIADLYPRDPDSGCYSDMTRTFCVGDPPDELVEYHRLCREALDLSVEAIRPGVTGAEVHRIVCELFQEHGYPTQLTKAPGEVLEEGFYHSLGHGVGLEVHEEPGLGRTGVELVAGDVLAVEPGLYRPGFGGCRLEDLVLVTDDGCEVLTDYPYELAP
jgi:Xaa-Pro aminopeptidase